MSAEVDVASASSSSSSSSSSTTTTTEGGTDRTAATTTTSVSTTRTGMLTNESQEFLSSCSWCTIGPPPSMILQIPPPPVPAFLVTDYYPSGALVGTDGLPLRLDNNTSSTSNINPGAPCRHSCEWRGAGEGVHYVEMPQQGNMFDDTWLLVLISSCVGVILIGVVLAAMLIKCKLQPDDAMSHAHVNDDASQCSSRSNKNSTLSTSTASSSMQTTTTSGTGPCLSSKTIARLQHEAAVLYPCAGQEDSRVMWATLTPRGTTRHYLEEHTYETIGNVCTVASGTTPPSAPPAPGSYVTTSMLGLAQQHHHHHHQREQQQEHKRHYSENHTSEHVNLKSYNEPPAPSPVMTRPKDEKAFDNTAFVDYEEPHTMKNEYYQLDDVLEPCDPIFSVQGMYGMPPPAHARSNVGIASGVVTGGGPLNSSTLRPRVSSPTRIEHPNLPPLNLQPTLPRSKHRTRKNSVNGQHHHHHHSLHHHHHHQQQQQQQQQQQHNSPDCSTLLRGGTTYIPTI